MTAEAQITETFDAAQTGRRRLSGGEKGKRRQGRFAVPAAGAEALKGETIRVIYLPGSPETSTPVDRRSLVWPLIFLGFTGFLGFSVHKLTRP